MAGQDQALKRATTKAYAYDEDSQWSEYWNNVLIPPQMSSRPESLEGNSVPWELRVAGNFELEGIELRAAMVDPELEPPRNVDIGYHATEHVPLASNPDLKEDQPFGDPHPDSADLENHKCDLVLKSPESGLHYAVKCDMEQPTTVCSSDQKAQVIVENTFAREGNSSSVD